MGVGCRWLELSGQCQSGMLARRLGGRKDGDPQRGGARSEAQKLAAVVAHEVVVSRRRAACGPCLSVRSCAVGPR